MSRFVKLTKFYHIRNVAYSEHGEPVWVNIYDISSMTTAASVITNSDEDNKLPVFGRQREPFTYIHMQGGGDDNSYRVCETPEQVIDLVEKAKLNAQ